MADEQGGSKLDKKAMGIGGASVFAVLTLLQGQGITLMNSGQETRNAQIYAKTVENSQKYDAVEKRTARLEQSVIDIQKQIIEGFDKNRNEIRQEVARISDIVRISASDRFTKTEHQSYSDSINARLIRLEDQVNEINKNK